MKLDTMSKKIHALHYSIKGFVSVIILVSILMASGCLDSHSIKNQTSDITVRVTDIPTLITTMSTTSFSTTCPTSIAEPYWIKINRISDISIGHPVLINGSTNIPIGKNLSIRMIPHMPPHSRYAPPEINGEVEISGNVNCSNFFTYNSNVTDLIENNNRSLIDVEVYSLDFNLSGYNYPANLSEFYITRH